MDRRGKGQELPPLYAADEPKLEAAREIQRSQNILDVSNIFIFKY